jgi:hypothetical protein
LISQLCVTLALLLSAPPDSGAASNDECPAVYEIVAAAAIKVLPEPIRPLFEARLDELQDQATKRLASDSGTTRTSSDAEAHYVMLDVGANVVDTDERRAAAHAFPQDRATAEKLYRQHRKHRGGTLPWILADRIPHLVSAFQASDEASAIREAGYLLHLVTDASLPFNTTANRDGEATGNVAWQGGEAGRATRKQQTVRHRLQCALIEHLRPRLECEIRVWPNRFQHVTNHVEEVFSVLLRATDDLDALLALDRELTTALGIVDAVSFASVEREYYETLADRAASMWEARLEAAALLSANLIGSAWIDAGRPQLTHATGASRETSKEMGKDQLVGSRSSGVFHRASCAHAKRISSTNLVAFSSVQDASAAGRRPCKICAPTSP